MPVTTQADDLLETPRHNGNTFALRLDSKRLRQEAQSEIGDLDKSKLTTPFSSRYVGWQDPTPTLPPGGTYKVQLTLTLCDGKALGMAVSIVRNREPALTTVALLVDPGGQPEYTGVASNWIDTFLISGNARNARRIIPTKTSADPDGMGVGRVSTKKFVSISHSGLQSLALPAMD